MTKTCYIHFQRFLSIPLFCMNYPTWCTWFFQCCISTVQYCSQGMKGSQQILLNQWIDPLYTLAPSLVYVSGPGMFIFMRQERNNTSVPYKSLITQEFIAIHDLYFYWCLLKHSGILMIFKWMKTQEDKKFWILT